MMQDFSFDRAVDRDEREAKLPTWAREKLDSLRRAATEARNELREFKDASEPGPFWLEDWQNNDRWYLPKSAGRLMFGDPASKERGLMLTGDVTLRPTGFLNINGSRCVEARPYAANVLLVRESPND